MVATLPFFHSLSEIARTRVVTEMVPKAFVVGTATLGAGGGMSMVHGEIAYL